ncbi:MAG: hypothetical protein K2J74_06620 [Muribaculaceae bacterium]|nr:hypothetical protein [Muribaculaceae bacterium]
MKTKLLTFSEEQLLEFFLTHRGTASQLPDGTLLRADGIVSDDHYRIRLRKAYAKLLVSGNPDLLPITDIAESLNDSLIINPDTLVAEITLPEAILMPVEISLTSWDTPVATFYKPGHPIAALQKNRFSQARAAHPVAVINRNKLLLYSAKSTADRIDAAHMVVRPPENFYTFPEAALPIILDA